MLDVLTSDATSMTPTVFVLGMVSDYLNVRFVFRQQSAYPQSTDEVVETFVSLFLAGIRNPQADGERR